MPKKRNNYVCNPIIEISPLTKPPLESPQIFVQSRQRQKSTESVSTLFDKFHAAPIIGPIWEAPISLIRHLAFVLS